MDVSVTKTSDGRTKIRIYNGGPGAFAEQRFKLYPPNYNGSNYLIRELSGGLASLTWEFYIEDHPELFIEPYPSQSFGTFAVGRETRYTAAWIGSTGWSEQEKQTVSYNIYSNSVTAPSIDSVSFAPSQILFDDSSLYVKTKNGVSVSEIAASGKCKASIVDVGWYVGGEDTRYSKGASSGSIKIFGSVPITFEAVDSRGLKGRRTEYITVHDYYEPSVAAAAGMDRVIAARADKYGNISDGESYIKIVASKRYAGVNGKNSCSLKYRIKSVVDSQWSELRELLSAASASNDYDDKFDAGLDEHVVYYIELVAVDRFGEGAAFSAVLPTEEVYIYRSGKRKSIAFGGHVTQDNAFEVYWGAYFHGGIKGDLVIEPSEDESVAGVILSSPSGKKYALRVDDNGAISTTDVSQTLLLGEE